MIEAGFQTLGPFGRIRIGTGLTAHIARGDGYSVRVESEDPKRLARLELRVIDNTLRASCASCLGDVLTGAFLFNPGAPGRGMRLFVTVPTLESLEITGAAEVHLESTIGDRLKISASTRASLQAEAIDVTALRLTVTTHAGISISGACEELDARFASGAEIAATELSCTRARISGSHGGSLDVTVIEAISGALSSGAQLHLLGRPETVAVRTSSDGQLMVA